MPKVPPVYDQYTRPPAEGLDCSLPVVTKREFAAESDLNVIMARYTETGELPESIVGSYGDFSDAPDFLEAQIIIARADAQFSALPAEVRARFRNNPAEFLEFVHDDANYDEARALGLLGKETRPAASKGSSETPASGGETPSPSLAKSS